MYLVIQHINDKQVLQQKVKSHNDALWLELSNGHGP